LFGTFKICFCTVHNLDWIAEVLGLPMHCCPIIFVLPILLLFSFWPHPLGFLLITVSSTLTCPRRQASLLATLASSIVAGGTATGIGHETADPSARRGVHGPTPAPVGSVMHCTRGRREWGRERLIRHLYVGMFTGLFCCVKLGKENV
jgi:peptidoglycan/LPS O-acetylase OafA/YrhL